MEVGAVILSGGKNSRMGTHKAGLLLDGQSFLERIRAKLSRFDELIISVADSAQHDICGMTAVSDIYKDCGPIGGLHASLNACRSDALLAVSCDMPLFDTAVIDYLLSCDINRHDAVVAVTGGNKLHPLCALYNKELADVFEKQILYGDYKLINVYKSIMVRYAPLVDAGIPDIVLTNVNTMEDYNKLLQNHTD